MAKTIIVSAASEGFGVLTARALAHAGHVVYAGFPPSPDGDDRERDAAQEYARTHGLQLRPIRLDLRDQHSVSAAVHRVVAEGGTVDAVVHSSGHTALGPAESFTPYQLAQLYDRNVLATQRLNRAVLPQMRKRREGLLVWVASSTTFGEHPPHLSPDFGAGAMREYLARTYSVELAPFGIDSTVVVPGAFSPGIGAASVRTDDVATARAYTEVFPGLTEKIEEWLVELAPVEADAAAVCEAVVRLVGLPGGERPPRVALASAASGAGSATAERVRAEFHQRIGFAGPGT